MDKTNAPRTLFGFRFRTLALLVALALAGTVALGLDLMNKGLVYDALWNVTGETAPSKQLLGFGQYLMRWTREQPDTLPYARIDHTDVSPFGVNTFLEQEVEPDKRERQAQMIADAGFKWIRQQFPWEDIEIHGKGDFVDRRNMDSVGEISAWDKYDNIVDLAEQYGLAIIARLNGPMPVWSLPEGATNRYTPPADFQDFVDYAIAVAERYQGRIGYYQVWNEPNLYPEWGDQTVNAEAYTDLLCRTYTALKTVDPDIAVITGALGPTIDLSGQNAYDLLYLQRMYQAGAGACFDVLSVQGYGLWSGPTDQRLRQVTINYQRHLWIRDMMVANGDAHKPIWISEAGWNPVPNDPAIADLDRYGRVTMDEAAEWAPLAYERAIEEWPWIGVINWWYFKPADDHNQGHSFYYFRLVEPDFTPTPVYAALKAYIQQVEPKTLGAGRHDLPKPGVTLAVIPAGEDDFVIHEFGIQGTGVYLCFTPGAHLDSVTIDGHHPDRNFVLNESGCLLLADDLAPGRHNIQVTINREASPESIVVVDYAARHRAPWLLTGIIAGVFVVVVLGYAVQQRLG
jgi:hypothetical protein